MKDNLLYVNARGLQIVYNVFMIAILWLTRGWRSGHWYFDAETITTPSNKVLHADEGYCTCESQGSEYHNGEAWICSFCRRPRR